MFSTAARSEILTERPQVTWWQRFLVKVDELHEWQEQNRKLQETCVAQLEKLKWLERRDKLLDDPREFSSPKFREGLEEEREIVFSQIFPNGKDDSRGDSSESIEKVLGFWQSIATARNKRPEKLRQLALKLADKIQVYQDPHSSSF